MTVDQVISTLFELGFAPAGGTRKEIVSPPAMHAPVYGGLRRTRRAFGGRSRYALPGSDLRVNVGPRTIHVYFSRDAGKPAVVLNEKTKALGVQELRDVVAAAAATERSPYEESPQR